MKSFIVLVSSLAVAACSPSLGLLADIAGGGLGGGGAGESGGIFGGEAVGAAIVGGIIAGAPGAVIGGIVGGLHGDAPPVECKDTVFKVLGTFTKGIPDAVGKDKLIFEDVVNLKLPGVLQDGYVSLVVVGRADGGIVNTMFPGYDNCNNRDIYNQACPCQVGTLLGNVVIAIGKIFDCVLAPQGKNVPYLCQKDFLSKYGYNDIDSCSSASDIIEFYKVKNAKKQAYKLMYDFTKGEGVQYLPTAKKIIFERFVLIAKLLEKDYSKWNSEDFKAYAVNIIIVTCTLIEYQQKGLGDQALDQYLEILSKYNENKQFPDLSYARQEISGIVNTVHKPNGFLEIRALNYFVKDLTDVVSKEKKLFSDIVSLKLPGYLEDGFNSLTVVGGRVVGGIIENAIPGLGRLFDNLVTAIGKIFDCVLGAPGTDPYICRKDYLSKYGYNDISSCNSANDIIDFYNVKNAKQQALKYVNDYTKGKGVEALSVNEKIVYEHILLIASLFDNDCGQWNSEVLKAYAINVAVVCCVIFESQQRALGRYALDEYIVLLSKYNKNKRFPDLSGSALQIYDVIGKVQRSTWNGAYKTTYENIYTETTDGLYSSVRTCANALPDSLGKAKKLLVDIGNIKLPGVLDDAFNSLVVVGRIDGAVANLYIPGLGDLFSNLVTAIGKIFVCILGPDADTHYLCQQDYLSEYGYNDIANYSSASDILEFYKVTNAKQQIEKIINDFTKGKGVESLSVNEKLIYDRVVAITSLLEKDYTKWGSEDMKKFAFSIVVMTCVVLETQQKGLGRGAVNDYIPSLVKYNTGKQFPDLSGSTQAVYDIINRVQPASFDAASKIKDSVGSQVKEIVLISI